MVALVAAVPIPIIDNLAITGSYLRDGFSWHWLTQPINHHAIIVPRLLLLIDLELTGGHMMLFVVLSLLAWGGIFILLHRQVIAAALDAVLGSIAVSLLAVVMFRGFLLESIVLNNGFNYPLTAFFTVLATVVAATLSQQRQRVFAVASLSAMAALAAGLCLINGVLAIPVAALVAWLRSRSVVALIPFTVAAFIALVIYVYGAATDLQPADVRIDFAVVLLSLMNLFGAPWVQKIGIAGQGVGLLVLLTAIASLWLVVRRTRPVNSIDAVAVMLIIFGIGSATMIAVGRPEISEIIGSAGRYGLWVALVHAGIIMIVMQIPVVTTWVRTRSFRVVLTVGFLLLTAEQVRYATFYVRIGADMQEAAAALREGDRSPALMNTIRSTQDFALPALNLYADRNLYGFYKPIR